MIGLPGYFDDPLLDGTVFDPSTSWAMGGPIIERHGIELWKWSGDDGTYWVAQVGGRPLGVSPDSPGPDRSAIGPTPLIAAMRALLKGKRNG